MRVSFSDPLVTHLIPLPEDEDRSSPWEIAARDRMWRLHKQERDLEETRQSPVVSRQSPIAGRQSSVVNMDPAVQVLDANFRACRTYVREKVAKVTVSLFKEGRFTGDGQSMDRNDGRLDLDVKSRDFDQIKIEIFPGIFLESEGLPLETTLQRVAFYQPYDSVDVYQYTANGTVELYSYDFDEDEIEVDVFDDVTRVVISLGNGHATVTKVEVGGPQTEGYEADGYDTVH